MRVALFGLVLAACLAGSARAEPDGAPYSVRPGLFDPAAPDLGLKSASGTQTFTVFRPEETTERFSNGVVLIPFKGRLYAQWQSSPRDEDSPDTRVVYAVSDDGENWAAPDVLAPPGQGGRMHSSGGWWADGETLVAYVNVWPDGFQSGAGGFTEYRLSTDGRTWSEPRRVMGADGQPVEGVIEQDPHRIGDRVMTGFHMRPGMIATPAWTTDLLGLSGWTPGRMTNLPRRPAEGGAAHERRLSREIEPSLFQRGDCAVMVFRDEELSFRQLASESCDGGETWTTPALTDMPDSRAKQSAGNLPDGTAFLVNAPNTDRPRIPLAVTLSTDGRTFDRSFLLRGQGDLQALRYEGQYKRPGYHYPKSVVWGDWLYVGYATNKEDVQVTRVPLSSLID